LSIRLNHRPPFGPPRRRHSSIRGVQTSCSAGLAAAAFSGCLPPAGTWLGSLVTASLLCDIHHTGVLPIPRLSPASSVLRASASCRLPVRGSDANRGPQSTTRTVPMSRRQPPRGPTARLCRQPVVVQHRSLLGNQASPGQTRPRSLAHRITWPNHVRPPTGHQFSSPCSPRNLAAPQLGSDTRPECLCLGGDFHPTDACAVGRTCAGACARPERPRSAPAQHGDRAAIAIHGKGSTRWGMRPSVARVMRHC
jgi:hypothetical protein